MEQCFNITIIIINYKFDKCIEKLGSTRSLFKTSHGYKHLMINNTAYKHGAMLDTAIIVLPLCTGSGGITPSPLQ